VKIDIEKVAPKTLAELERVSRWQVYAIGMEKQRDYMIDILERIRSDLEDVLASEVDPVKNDKQFGAAYWYDEIDKSLSPLNRKGR